MGTVEVAVEGQDVEASTMHGRRVEGKCALELQQRLVGAVVRVARAHHVAHERMTGVGDRHVQEMALLAALGVMDVAGACKLSAKAIPRSSASASLVVQLRGGCLPSS